MERENFQECRISVKIPEEFSAATWPWGRVDAKRKRVHLLEDIRQPVTAVLSVLTYLLWLNINFTSLLPGVKAII